MKAKVFHLTKMKGVSGSENHLMTLLSEIDRECFEIHLGILAEPAHIDALQDYASTLRKHGVHVIIFRMRKYLDLSLLLRLRKYIRQEHVQIVHTHLIHADLYGTLAAKWAGVPCILSSRHNDDRFRHHVLIRLLNRVLARWQNRIIVISDWIGSFLEHVEGIPAEKIVRIHYGLQAEEFADHDDPAFIRRELKIPEHVPLIGTIGRLTEQKGQRDLLQAAKLLIPSFPELRIVLIGDGELRGELQKQARELGLEKHIIFTGGRDRNDALTLLSGFDFFVFPSLWEGFGLVLLEAMAFKKAVVASRVSAIPESVVHGETGLLVPPGSPEELAEAIETLLKNPETYMSMGEAGYRHLAQTFSVKKMILTTERLYRELLS